MNDEEKIIAEIVKATKESREKIIRMIGEKEMEFSGLVSRIGAAYIVGKELGVDLVKSVKKDLKISSIVPNINRLNFIGKVVEISPVKEFETKNGKGKVVNIVLGDETGTIRLSLWNEKTEVIERIKEDDVLEVINGFTKKDNYGNPEVRLGKFGNLRKVDDVKIEVKETQANDFQPRGYAKKTIDSLEENSFAEVKACVLQIYQRALVHYLCPSCNKKLKDSKCEKHGSVEPDKFLVVSGVIDDGYDNVNAVFFRESAEKVLGMNVDAVEKGVTENGGKGFFSAIKTMGETFIMKGVVKKNDFTNSFELSVREVRELDVKKEINSLLTEIP